MFEPVGSKVSFPQVEEQVLAMWKDKDIFRRSLEGRGWQVRDNVKLASREDKAAEVQPITSPGARGAAKITPTP